MYSSEFAHTYVCCRCEGVSSPIRTGTASPAPPALQLSALRSFVGAVAAVVVVVAAPGFRDALVVRTPELLSSTVAFRTH